MQARDVMTREVVATAPEASVKDVAVLMINNRVSGVPVLDQESRLVGIVTEGDLLRRAESGTVRRSSRWSEWFAPNSGLAAEYAKSHGRRVADVMTREVATLPETAGLVEIADLMETKGIKRIPVMEDGRLVGIVSRANLLQVLASGGVTTADEERDRTIRTLLVTELRKHKWGRPAEDSVVVADGVVHLWGVVGSEAERNALRVAGENVPGVRSVEDHTTLPGPVFPIIH
jgi:CBS domain-containing protein